MLLEFKMMALALIAIGLGFVGLSTAGAWVESIATDELDRMGIAERSERSDLGRDFV